VDRFVMMKRPTTVIDLASLPALDPLIEAYPFKPYRNYRVLSRRRQDEVMRAEIRAALEQPGGFGLLADGDVPSSAVVVRPLPWDSAFFGLSMARLFVLHQNDVSRDALRVILAASFQECRDRQIHVRGRQRASRQPLGHTSHPPAGEGDTRGTHTIETVNDKNISKAIEIERHGDGTRPGTCSR